MIIEIPDDKINELQVTSMKKAIERSQQAHFADFHIRVNGKWEKFEADWLKHMEIKNAK